MNEMIKTIRSDNIAGWAFASLMGLAFRYIYGLAKNLIFSSVRDLNFGVSTHPTAETDFFALTITFNLGVDLASSFIAAAICGAILVYVVEAKARILCIGSVLTFFALSSRLWRFWKYPELGMQISSFLGPVLAGVLIIFMVHVVLKARRITPG